MRTWVKNASPAALLALGVMSLGGGTAFADTDGSHSIGGGNQVNLPITLPIDISGNGLAVLGETEASSRGGASVEQSGGGSGAGGNRTDGRHSILGGNQVVAPITAPINACGNAVAIFGESEAGCKGGAEVKQSGKGGAGGNTTSGRGSILGGNQVVAPITAPINACGNAVAIFGESEAGCKGGAEVKQSGKGRGGAGGNRTDGRFSIGGGNQVVAPITAPLNICGNSVAVLGEAFAGCKGGASVTDGGPGHGKPGHGYHGKHGKHGWGSGGAGGNTTSGRGSILGGNQVVAPITAPINVCGNAVGNAEAGCKGGASVTGGGKGAGGNRTDGRGSILGGNQVVAPITAPINVCGNAVAILGDSAAGCLGGAHVGSSGHGHGHGHWDKKAGKHKTSGMLPALPVVPALNGAAQQGPSLPVVGGAQGLTKLPAVPASAQGNDQDARQDASPLAPATGLLSSTPVGELGLMSAAQPAGVAGMNSSSLLALVFGGLAAASASMFALTRRVRTAKR
ncbi:chaplin family protein [Planomonospora venezuelensis]|uniref:Chaplin domain-containing protein n=1 Tax=Planomonospora venezuelensis TaxID=1999 RepID=A0A841D8M2_PLAVE|nr:chaplin family protein [Planomonospora venezuelensis]MBB5963756.1 hypothetical protein [Planomonospora venezuelensis]GIN02173.1 hypothetical protein Pve01_38310 [Planomonospora venezuelensis]